MSNSVYTRPEHEELRRQVARFIAAEVEPNALGWDEAGATPREVLRKMGALGWLGLMYPPEYGGAGVDMTTNVVFQEALSRATSGGFIITVLVHTDMASRTLHRRLAGPEDALAASIITGELISAVAVTEPDAGSDVAAIRTRAVRDGDHWLLNGSKMFITNGVLADLVFVAARSDPVAKGSRGISIFAVERGTPGFRVGRAFGKQAGSRPTPPNWYSRAAGAGVAPDRRGKWRFQAIMRNFQTERIALGAMAVRDARQCWT